MSQPDGSNRKRNYYVDYTRNRAPHGNRGRYSGSSAGTSRFKSTPELSFGNRGFLITSIDEVKSYLEMRNIFESYYEQLCKKSESGDDNQKSKCDDSVCEDELEEELNQLRRLRPFKQVKTQCRNTLFINITKDFSDSINPMKIVDMLFDELAEKREIKTSNTYKVLPILDTFRVSLACAKESITAIMSKDLKEDGENSEKTYFIELQSRGNYKLSSEDKQSLIEGVAKKITDLRPNWKVDRENADYIVVLVALKDVCCIAFLKDYFKRAKYNVSEFCKDFAPSNELSPEANNEIPQEAANEDA